MALSLRLPVNLLPSRICWFLHLFYESYKLTLHLETSTESLLFGKPSIFLHIPSTKSIQVSKAPMSCFPKPKTISAPNFRHLSTIPARYGPQQQSRPPKPSITPIQKPNIGCSKTTPRICRISEPLFRNCTERLLIKLPRTLVSQLVPRRPNNPQLEQ